MDAIRINTKKNICKKITHHQSTIDGLYGEMKATGVSLKRKIEIDGVIARHSAKIASLRMRLRALGYNSPDVGPAAASLSISTLRAVDMAGTKGFGSVTLQSY